MSAILATVGVIFVLAVIGAVAYYGFHYNALNSVQGNNNPSPNNAVGSCPSFYCGVLTVGVAYLQAADLQTVPSLTSPAFAAYPSGGSQLSSVTSGSQLHGAVTGITSAATGTLQLGPQDQGVFFMTLSSGTADFIDVPVLKAQNPSITSVAWTAVQGGNSQPIILASGGITYTMVVQVNTANVVFQSGQTPKVTLTITTLHDDSGSVSATAPSNLASQGTTVASLTSEWKLSGFTNQHGASITRIYVTSNQTTSLFVNPTSLSINGFASWGTGTFSVASCGTSSSGITDCFDFYDPAGSGTQPAVGLLVLDPVGASTTLYFDVTWTRALGASTHVSIVLNVEMLSPSGTVTTLTSSQGVMGNA